MGNSLTRRDVRTGPHALPLCLVGLLLCLIPAPLLGQQDGDGNLTAPQRKVRPGRLIVEVIQGSDGSPVAGIRVELLQTGQVAFTDTNGRVEFVLPPGEYDARVFGLNGPGPALLYRDLHASVKLGRPVVVQAIDCDVCV